MKYVLSMMEATGSREDWKPLLQIPIDLPEELEGWKAENAFTDAVEQELKAQGIIRKYGQFTTHLTQAVPEMVNPQMDQIAVAFRPVYERMAEELEWNEED